MTRAKRMKPVQNLFDDTERRLAVGLATIERKVADAETKLQELERYLGDYEKQFKQRAGRRHRCKGPARLPGFPGAADRGDSPAAGGRETRAVRARCRAATLAGGRETREGARPRRRAMADRGAARVGSTRATRERRARPTQSEQDMTPTNLPVQPSTPATPASGLDRCANRTGADDGFPADVGAARRRIGPAQRHERPLRPPKVPSMILDETAKKDEIDPEQLLAMFAMPLPPQLQPIDMPVEQALQALPGMSGRNRSQKGPRLLRRTSCKRLHDRFPRRKCSPTSWMT